MSELRQTHTYAILEVSGPVYEEIRQKLKDAGYRHAFHFNEGRELIDMGGIALQRAPAVNPQDSSNHEKSAKP